MGGKRKDPNGKRLTWEEAQKQRDKEIQCKFGDQTGRVKPRNWLPWLWIRGSEADVGARPVPATGVWYGSPDIVVEGDGNGNAIAGQPNTVYVRVWNMGRAPAAPTRLEVGWANPALGLGPGHIFPFKPNDTSDYDQIPPLSAKWIKHHTPWVPVLVNNGHECLFANCDNWVLDPLLYPWQPVVDRHAGQKNVTVLPALAGEIVKFTVEFNNIFPYASEATLGFRVDQLTLTQPVAGLFEFNEALGALVAFGAPTIAVRQSAQRKAAIRAKRPLSLLQPAPSEAYLSQKMVKEVSGRGAASIASSIDHRTAIVDYANADEYVGRLFLARASNSTRACQPMNVLHQIAMQPFEQRHLTLELGVPAGCQPGDFVVFHLAQENEGFVLGGYVIVIRVTEHKGY